MLGDMLVACVVGRTVFVHAGLMVSNEEYGGVSRLNEETRDWICKCE